MGNFVEGQGFVMLMGDSLVEVSKVKADAEGAIWFPGVGEE